MRPSSPLKQRSALLAGLVLALTCLPLGLAQAEEEEFVPELELGLHGGGHFFSSTNALGRDPATDDNVLQHSGGVGARLGLGLSPHWMPELEFLFVPTKTASGNSNVSVVAWRAHLMYHFLTGRVRPFVLVGLGAMSTFSNNQQELHDSTDPLFHTGVGVKIDITRHFGIRLDGRLLLPSDVRQLMAPDYEALLGIYGRFMLGKPLPPPDADGDGIPDAQDQCPKEPGPRENNGCPDKDTDGDGIVDRLDKCPDRPGPKENNGCPWPDADNDGVPDSADQCPTVPGPKENNGCPDKDTDGDGVVDRLDKCPDKAGPKENDGCPWPDADGDGIPDKDDKCPNQPETRNGYQDEDGCPDEVPKAVKRFTGVIQGINFETGKAVILKSSFPLLDKAVGVLKEYDSVRLEIQGHTDNQGTHEYNMKLSQERANAVRDYMVQKGVSADRLRSAGFGPDKPIADNKTAAGRAKNRRVEFLLVSALTDQAGTTGQAPPAMAPPAQPDKAEPAKAQKTETPKGEKKPESPNEEKKPEAGKKPAEPAGNK